MSLLCWSSRRSRAFTDEQLEMMAAFADQVPRWLGTGHFATSDANSTY